MRAQTAKPIDDPPDWEDDSSLPSDPVAAIERVRARVNTAGRIGQATYNGVEQLRQDFSADIRAVNRKVDELNDQFTTLSASSARMEGQLVILVDRAGQEHRDLAAVRVSAIQARIEVEKSERIERPRFRREVTLRIVVAALAGTSAVLSAILGLLLSGKC